MKIPRPTFSGVVAILALCVAMSGTAYAAASLPKNSVGSKQIKTGAVRSSDIRNGAVAERDLAAPVKTALADKAPTAYQVDDSTIQFVGSSFASFATLTIPEAGDYLVTANLRVFPRVGNPGDGLFCNILGAGSISIVNQGVDMPQGVAQVTMHGIIPNVAPGTTLDLQCRAATNEITLTYDWTAVQVDLQ
ncbi:hypothetical protein [Nocardioides sp.]|uniref:hypothetical protein n=1 Tax=Nocardioides sp. TaxID=35761 RepID=UPI0035630F53